MRTAIYSFSPLSILIFRVRLSEVRVFSTRNSDVMYFRHSSASVTKLLIFRTPGFRNGSLFAFSVGVLSSFTTIPCLSSRYTGMSIARIICLFWLLYLWFFQYRKLADVTAINRNNCTSPNNVRCIRGVFHFVCPHWRRLLYKKREDCYCLSAFEALENAHTVNRQQPPRLSI